LTAWNEPIGRPAELLADPGVADRVLERALGDAGSLGGGEHGRQRAQRRRVRGEWLGRHPVEVQLAQASRRIDARPRRDGDARIPGGDVARGAAPEHEEAAGGPGVRHAAGDSGQPGAAPECLRWIVDHRDAQLAAQQGGTSRPRRERVRREHRAEPGPGRERPAQLDEEKHLLRDAVARAARRLGKPEAEPAERRRLAPERLVEARLRGHDRAHARERQALGEYAADRVAHGRLLGSEGQVHPVTAAARARARR